jgi:hypothetical protein
VARKLGQADVEQYRVRIQIEHRAQHFRPAIDGVHLVPFA